MNVGIVGSGSATDAVRAALGDGVAIEETEASDVDDTDLAIVVDTAGAAVFGEANEVALASETPWLAVELGGLAGRGLCTAAITGFAPETACYACLCSRVEANVEDAAGDPDEVDDATAWLAGARAGYEARRLADGEESAVLGGVVEIPHAEHRLLPVPNCECETEERAGLDRDYEARDLQTALGHAEQALDRRTGIVREVGEVASFPAPYYLARAGETAGFSEASAASEAAGVAVGWDEALMKALGEALERYSAGVYRDESFTYGSPEEVENPVPPSSFVLPEEVDADPGDSIPWVEGEHLSTGESVQLPAEFVTFPPPERRHGPSITTGLGLGSSGAEALCSGLYEVVERDAAMLSWYSSFEPLRLAVDAEPFATLAARARSEDLTVRAALITQDVDVPVVAVGVGRGEWPELALGSAANFDPEAAAGAALAEALQNWMELRAMGPEEADGAGGAVGRYATTPGDAAAFFDVDARIPAASAGPATAPEGGDELELLLERVADAGLDAYAARLTPRDVDALGFEAVRVLVPDAQPLFTDEPYFGERARTVPEELGFDADLDREFHPYP